MGFREEVWPFVVASLVIGAVVGVCVRLGASGTTAVWSGSVTAAVLVAYMFYFFRDPERQSPTEPGLVVAAADGVVARIAEVDETEHLRTRCVRVSIFLSLFNVHVNRSPIGGQSRFLGYFPGKRLFTFTEKSSEVNQHNSILIEGEGTRCLVKQIVGPVCRRVVYWPDPTRAVTLARGERIGMMKFGSRLDMYFPLGDITLAVKEGDRATAGVTVIGRLARGAANP